HVKTKIDFHTVGVTITKSNARRTLQNLLEPAGVGPLRLTPTERSVSADYVVGFEVEIPFHVAGGRRTENGIDALGMFLNEQRHACERLARKPCLRRWTAARWSRAGIFTPRENKLRCPQAQPGEHRIAELPVPAPAKQAI